MLPSSGLDGRNLLVRVAILVPANFEPHRPASVVLAVDGELAVDVQHSANFIHGECPTDRFSF